MGRLRYFTPFVFLALLPIGGWLGGAWTFAAAIATAPFLTGLDTALGDGEESAAPASGKILRWLPRIYVVLNLSLLAWAMVWVTRPATSQLELMGMIVSAAILTGVFGFVAAHETIHSRDPRERALGLLLLASVFYMHFRIAHVHGHHRRAATLEDPATARFNEGLYAFLVRSVAGQFREAWIFEKQRRRRLGVPTIGIGNRMVSYIAIELSFLIAVAFLSNRALIFVVAVAVLAVVLLESFNYVAHYGLLRRTDADGRQERIGPQHSWNTAKRMNNAALFNMGRHSDHHRRMVQSYDRLEPVPGEAKLPSGYAAALLTALVPMLWRRVMNPRAEAQRRYSRE